MPKKDAVVEKEDFSSDTCTTAEDRNSTLAQLLNALWNPHEIVKIDRIEIGSKQGWRVTYRK
jgi:hypothetical protein